MSTHIVRKQGIADSAFNHQVHNLLEDNTKDDESDDDVPEMKNQYFEFSNGYHIMRVIRLIFVIQIIGLLLDNPSIQIPTLFDTFCRGISFYSIHFMSRPFLDIIYVIQSFFSMLRDFLLSQKIPINPTSIVIEGRRLNVNPYLTAQEQPSTPPPGWRVNALDDRDWLRFYSCY